MKEAGNLTGALLTTIFSIEKLDIKDIFIFKWWAIALITIYLISLAILGGMAGALAQESAAKFIKRWNGKKKDLKQST